MKLTDLQANDLLTALKTVDGAGSGLDTDKVRGTNPFTANKNKIINGDMQVAQRGRVHYLENDSDYTIDRVKVSTDNDNAVEVRQELIYSVDEGSWKDETNPFGDGKQHNLWQFDGNADDTNGNNDGILHGDATFVDDVLPGIGSCKVLSLDGDRDYVSTDFKIGEQTQYTLSAWFKTSEQQNAVILGSKDSDGTAEKVRGSITLLDNNSLELTMGDDDNVSTEKAYLPYSYSKNNWNNIVVSINNDKQTLYYNGKKVGTYTLSINTGTSSDYKYSIGREGESDTNYFKGKIARAKIFLDKALTEDEIRKLYVEDSKYITKTHIRTNIMKKGDTYTVTPYEYRFEGQDIVPLINDKAVLSFNLASSKNQDFTIRLKYPDGSEFKSATISYNGDKEFTKHSVVFDMTELDISKIPLDENLGLILTIGENDELDVGNFIRLTDIQLEAGEVATEFERVSYDIQLSKCMRYFEVFHINDFSFGYLENTTRARFVFNFNKNKRIIPNVLNIKPECFYIVPTGTRRIVEEIKELRTNSHGVLLTGIWEKETSTDGDGILVQVNQSFYIDAEL